MPSRSTQGLSTLLMRSATLGGDLSAARCAIPARPSMAAAARSFHSAAGAAPPGRRSATTAHAPAAAPPPDDSSPDDSSPQFVFLDTETTGFNPAYHRIVSVATSIRGVEYSQIVNPKRPIPLESSKVHGLHDHHVRGKPTWAAVSRTLWALFPENAVIVAHNGESPPFLAPAPLARVRLRGVASRRSVLRRGAGSSCDNAPPARPPPRQRRSMRGCSAPKTRAS